MSASHPSVHPVDAVPPPATDAAAAAAEENPMPRGRMKDVQGMPGTPSGLALRLFQFAFSAVALSVMASTSDFPSVTAFRYLVVASSLQSIWSLSLAIVDVYAILVKRSLRNFRVATLFAVGDGITSTLIFSAACASAGITVLIGNDLNDCTENHCTRFQTATAMAFLSWFAGSPSFLFNFWTLASK
ncbi:hypothetical protein L484_000635 [Morus notabilis]|uniref:CASP-like protein n=1 Tax=Morus notabilis TaxID=981085 RepID=W9QLE2_9ROSA|nr:CASP-like protein 5A2 [Morus notabilis]EXB30188.1 hypothetical protein L484_000635 [Morus notabilis]